MLTVRIAFILLFFVGLSPKFSSAGERTLIFNPPGSFLGSGPVSRADYLAGVLDAFFYVEKSGILDRYVARCLFDDENTTSTQIALSLLADDAVGEKIKTEGKDFNVVTAIVDQLKVECSKKPSKSTQ